MINICKNPDCDNIAENEYCATCAHKKRKQARLDAQHAEKRRKAAEDKKSRQARQTRIKPVSRKTAKALSEYSRLKKEWIQGKKCAVFPVLPATDIHHMKGRQGYADQWARDQGIPLLIDVRFWLAVSRKGHIEIEGNRAWAEKKGFTLSRLEKKV